MKDKVEITKSLLDKVGKMIQETLVLSQRSFGQFITKTSHAVSLPDPKATAEWQENLDHAVSLLAICHVMSIFEDAFPKECWEDYIPDSQDYEKLMAYKHIRNCASNGFTGKRELNDLKERGYFNKVMKSAYKLQGISSFSSRKITLGKMAAYDANIFITVVSNKINAELHKQLYHGG